MPSSRTMRARKEKTKAVNNKSEEQKDNEPDAALVIRIALNKKNEVAMKIGRLEIMAVLVKRCNPNARGTVAQAPPAPVLARGKECRVMADSTGRRRHDCELMPPCGPCPKCGAACEANHKFDICCSHGI